MNSLSVVMLGASGAVGGHVVKTMAQNELAKRTLLVRRKIAAPARPEIAQRVVDVLNPDSYGLD